MLKKLMVIGLALGLVFGLASMSSAAVTVGGWLSYETSFSIWDDDAAMYEAYTAETWGSPQANVLTASYSSDDKKFGAILQHEPEVARRHSRPHTAVIALDQRHHIAVSVSNGQVDRIALVQFLFTCRKRRRCLVRCNQLATFRRVVFRNQPVHGDVSEIHVDVIFCPVFECELLCLDERVQVLSAPEPHRCNVITLKDIEDLQRGNTLPIRR